MLKQFIKRSKLCVIVCNICDNWLTTKRFNSGVFESSSGSNIANVSLSENLSNISTVFDDYLKYKVPIITPVELEILLGKKKWEDYQFDQIINQ